MGWIIATLMMEKYLTKKITRIDLEKNVTVAKPGRQTLEASKIVSPELSKNYKTAFKIQQDSINGRKL
jgi:hypothetical protein